MFETKTKSPSIRKRDMIRMFEFNMKKKEQALASLQQELSNKSRVVLKLETEISCMKFNHYMRSDTEFFILLPRAKIGNLPASAKFLRFPPIFSMIFYVVNG
jgi:hypothetical protein